MFECCSDLRFEAGCDLIEATECCDSAHGSRMLAFLKSLPQECSWKLVCSPTGMPGILRKLCAGESRDTALRTEALAF